ncbi:hypothetical protein CROQUDRAFT_104383 [Cronartium quercuum f. sp. fusiforme G11]|uniref:Uncharacterized protein n=1 Tax=Cronartium quercuum f. sp. fusiforme G11 TaxID=708437 RepID=A0A9P6NTV4_9BASI|nr:hypothetical protein CROQUDRAFT_104383 [Cronartium quercuum f. sp. fusiforme G11]
MGRSVALAVSENDWSGDLSQSKQSRVHVWGASQSRAESRDQIECGGKKSESPGIQFTVKTRASEMPVPTRPPDPPGHLAKRPTISAKSENNSTSASVEPNGTPSNSTQQSKPMTPEEKILALWRHCGQKCNPEGQILIDPMIYDMMDAFLESVRDTNEPIRQLRNQASPNSLATSLASATSVPTLPPPAIMNKSWSTVVATSQAAKQVKALPKPPINAALLTINAKIDETPIQINGASRLPSGDLLIHAYDRIAACWILENRYR